MQSISGIKILKMYFNQCEQKLLQPALAELLLLQASIPSTFSHLTVGHTGQTGKAKQEHTVMEACSETAHVQSTKGWFDSLLINNQTEWFKNQVILGRKWFIIKSSCNFGNILSKTLSKAVETLGKKRRHDSDKDLNVTSRQSVDILESLRLKWDWTGLPLQSLLVCSMSASAT